MKIMTKVIANQLKCILGEMINEPQCAFVLGRLIIYNLLIAFEVFHYMRTEGRTNHPLVSLKLDMAKGYDRIE